MSQEEEENFQLIVHDDAPSKLEDAFPIPSDTDDWQQWQYDWAAPDEDPQALSFVDSESFSTACSHYDSHFTCKELLLIWSFYADHGIPSCNAKTPKYLLVSTLVEFELNPEHAEIVEQRQTFWFYMTELQQNKFMSKYVHGPFFRW